MPKISLVHSSARIPTGWRPAAEHWHKTADNASEIEYVLVTDDPIDVDPVFENTVYQVNHGVRSAVAGYNLAAQISTGKLIVMIADDYFSPKHWDTHLLAAVPDLDQEAVLDVDNGDGSDMLAFSMETRAYYQRYGYLFHESYDGLMADQEHSDIARRDGVVVNAKHIKFKHLNPDSGDVAWDSIYQSHRSREKLAYGQRVYARRKALGFPNP